MEKRNFILIIICLVFLFFLYLSQNPFKLENTDFNLSRECYKVIFKNILGNSMAPLLMNGEKVKVLFGYYNCHPLLRNDIVIISFKTQPNKFYVKKLVGLPNDHVEVKNGLIYLNNEVLKNNQGDYYKVEGKGVILLTKPLINQRIPEGYYLVLAEETNPNAFDSRYFGYLEKNHIKGKVIDD
ncbi:MAG: signal peptidase I [Minisyncoccia bacterium]